MRYSYSRINAYRNCPYQYKLQYIDKIDRETQGIEGFLGNRVHEVLEKLYEDIKHAKTPSLEELLDYYEAQWTKNWNSSVKIVKQEYTVENYKDIGKVCIINYYNHYAPFDKEKTLAVERPFPPGFSLDGNGKYTLGGRIDRITQTKDGTYEIHDYKTSQYLPPDSAISKDIQLPIYQMALKEMWHEAENIELVWHFLVFDKEMRTTKTKVEIQAVKELVMRLIDEIEAIPESEFKPVESNLCPWCDYQDLCPAKKHALKVELLPPNEFLNDTGVDLANKYVAAKEEEKTLTEKIERLKEAIFEYAQRESVNMIVGSDNELKIGIESTVKFPTKTDNIEKYTELSKILIDSGKWFEVSDLNYRILAKIVQSNTWEKELLERIKTYQESEERKKITMRKRKEVGE